MIQQGFVREMWIKQFCEYFDPFGLIMLNEIKNYLKTSGKKIVYSSDEIQERDSFLCGYWCLYYLLERQNSRRFLDVIRNTKFIFTDQMINHQFLINYFKLMESYYIECQKSSVCIAKKLLRIM